MTLVVVGIFIFNYITDVVPVVVYAISGAVFNPFVIVIFDVVVASNVFFVRCRSSLLFSFPFNGR